MKEIKRVETTEEAILIKSLLESSGIDCFLQDQETVSVYFIYSNAIGGIKILVPEENEIDAIELLNCAPLRTSEKHCPHCNSQNIRYRKLGLLNGICIFSGFCLPSNRSIIYCHDCETNFQEDEIKINDVSNYPELIELNKAAESQLPQDVAEKELPSYFSILKYALSTIVIMLALTPLYYIHNKRLPSSEHFIWGIFAGIILGMLMRYGTTTRLTEAPNQSQ